LKCAIKGQLFRVRPRELVAEITETSFVEHIHTGTCFSGASYATPSGCPNNSATFGSVYNTIGSNRMITMGIHITY
jgi:hypothetical protein